MELRQSHFVLGGRRSAACSALWRWVAAAAAPSDGQTSFDRAKGNCLTCHEIKGGDDFGNVGPALVGLEGALSRPQGSCARSFSTRPSAIRRP